MSAGRKAPSLTLKSLGRLNAKHDLPKIRLLGDKYSSAVKKLRKPSCRRRFLSGYQTT